MHPSTHASPAWRLYEVASVGRENLDADHVARYDAKMDAGALVEAGLATDAVVVDLGAGTGQFTLAMAPGAGGSWPSTCRW